MSGLKLNTQGAIIGIDMSAAGGGSFSIVADRFTFTGPMMFNGITIRRKPDYAAKRAKDQAAPWYRRLWS